MDNKILAQNFLEENLFFKDKLMKQYFQKGYYQKFRTRSKQFRDYDKKLEKVTYAYITHCTQDILYKECSNLGKAMSPAGFLILCGGSAINQYLPPEHHSITTDIDFKFIPTFKDIAARSDKYFGYIQYAKLLMWDEIGKLSKKLTHNPTIKKRLKALQNSPIGKCLQLNFDNIRFTRRYIVLHKKKQSANNNVKKGDILIDVELFAVDIRNIKFFPSKYTSLSGILDFPFMRRGEIGGKVLKGAKKGIMYPSVTGKKIFNPNILVANKRFLLDDIYLMKSLGLRPEKSQKDRSRMEKLAKYAFKTEVANSNTNLNIIKKISKKSPVPSTFLKQAKKMPLERIERINPNTYADYTTILTPRQAARIAFPMYGPRGVNVNGYKPTGDTRYKFDNATHKWVYDPSRRYIRNTATYRIHNPKVKDWRNLPKVKVDMTSTPYIYGYDIKRDRWLTPKMISKVSKIPLSGHKELAGK